MRTAECWRRRGQSAAANASLASLGACDIPDAQTSV